MKRLWFAVAMMVLAGHAGLSMAQEISSEDRARQARSDLASVQGLPELIARARQYEAEEDWSLAAVAWERAAALRPHQGGFAYEAVVNHARAKQLSHAYNILLVLQSRGLGYDLEADERLANLHGTELWLHLVELNKGALGGSFGEGVLAFELPPADLLLESIAWNPSSKRFLFGSARDGVIYQREGNGELKPWSRPQGDSWWSIFDIKVDAARNLMWATTAAVPHFHGFKPDMTGKSALLKLDLRDGKLLAAYPAPADGLPHILNGIAVSSRGMVVVAEGMRGQLFRLDGDALDPVMAEPQLNALRGLAFSTDDQILYFADHERGLFGFHLNTGTAFDVRAPNNVTLGGIEGLYLYNGQLIAVQNGMKPQRVMRFKLDGEGRAIELGVPLDANHEEFTIPTLGTLSDEGFFFLANSQRHRYDGYGLLRGGVEALEPVRIFRSNPRFNWDYEAPRRPGPPPAE